MKRMSILIVVFMIAVLHSGGTDGAGGHYNRETGNYHYHHGYPAHNHYDMNGDGIKDCPYKFDNNTTHNNNSSTNSDNKNNASTSTDAHKEKPKNDVTVSDIIQVILVVACFFYPAFCILIFVCGGVVSLIEEKFKVSASDRFMKIMCIVLCVVIVISLTLMILNAKGIL